MSANKAKKNNKSSWKWAALIFLLSIVISAIMSLISSRLLSGARIAAAFAILFSIILIGILFDILGVAVTAADEKPFHAMASRKVPEAQDAIRLLRSADRVSSFCNDVIGDICGIVSGAAAAGIAARILLLRPTGSELFLNILLSAFSAGLTIGGKACCKSFAIQRSTEVVTAAARFLCFFRTLFRKRSVRGRPGGSK